MDETRECLTGKSTELNELAEKMVNNLDNQDDDEEMAVGFGLIDGRIVVS